MSGADGKGLSARLRGLARWPGDCLTGVIVALVSLAAYAFIGHVGRPDFDVEREGQRLSGILKWHDEKMGDGLTMIAEALRDSCVEDTLRAVENVAKKVSADDEYAYYIFRDDDLRYWHNAMLPAGSFEPWQIHVPITATNNGFYYVKRLDESGCTAYVMLWIRSTFPYNNDYLADGFSPSFGLPPTSGLSTSPRERGADLVAPDGRHLLTVTGPWRTSLPSWAMALSVVCLITFALSLLWVAGRCALHALQSGWDGIAAVSCADAFYVIIYLVMLHIAPPWGGGSLLMFSAADFSYDWWLPSYWILATIAVCDLHCAYTLFRVADVRQYKLAGRGKWGPMVLAALLTLMSVASFLIANGVVETLVRHSNGLSFYAGEIDMSVTSVVKLCIIGAAAMAFLFTADRSVSLILQLVGRWPRVALLTAGTVVTASAGAMLFDASGASVSIGFAVLCVAMYFMKRSSSVTIRFSHFVWAILIVSGFTLLRMTQLNESKEHSYRQLLASNLAFQMVREDDPIAEQLLPQVYTALKGDTALTSMMSDESLSYDKIYTHIRNHYFNGYFSRYDLQIIPCRGLNSTIQLTTNGDVKDCVSYFQNLTTSIGRKLTQAPEFFCLYDDDSRPCYLATLNYDDLAPSAAESPNRLYVQIILKSTPRSAGYPELLTNKRDVMSYRAMKGYSYAKYDKTRLTYHHGDFDYPGNVKLAADGSAQLPESDAASHYVLRTQKQQTIVVTYPRQSLSNVLTCFSYMFLGLIVVASLIMLAVSRSQLTFFGHMDISERIHASLVFFIIVFFGVISVISGYQAVDGYEAVNKRHLSQAMSSFYVALSDELYDRTASDLHPGPATSSELDYLLQHASNATGDDAHLFDTRGRLIGTSRRELFLSGVASPLMNSEALLSMRSGEQSEAFIMEHIGSMVQYAAYTPIYNGTGEILGYINVPMFNDVSAMRSHIMASIEPMTNSLVIIVILSILASAILARGITQPLIELRDMLKSVDLQSADVRLAYPYDDEVGQVVTAYNKMNDKLRAQAEKLAATERESTWREMARQIAHEIKNPLTPMKLSIQYLLKCWDARRDNFEPMLKKTAQTLVDQIDQLSAVASQFSGIAKMKQAEPVVYDLAARLSATAMMFGRSEESEVTYCGPQEGVMIKADPDLMTSVFNNLIKNAQQSAADGRKVQIAVCLSTTETQATVTVTDNGDGIPDEIREKIFRPNFTTKSTGMGLGLAITKNIVDNSDGEISFDTEVGHGTTFTVALPIHKQ